MVEPELDTRQDTVMVDADLPLVHPWTFRPTGESAREWAVRAWAAMPREDRPYVSMALSEPVLDAGGEFRRPHSISVDRRDRGWSG